VTKKDEEAAEKVLDTAVNLLNSVGYSEVIVIAGREIKDDNGHEGVALSLVVNASHGTLYESIGMLIETLESPNFNEPSHMLQ
jgi:hypothetical protein